MARAAVLGRVTWRVATVVGDSAETATARTLRLQVPDWPGHLAGQHVDIRLTAEDGYTATRSYSIASAPTGDAVDVTVEELPDGEVSPYLVRDLAVGDPVEVRGPVGGWFVWRPSQVEKVQLIAGGSGIVPLMAMLRTHAQVGSSAPVRLLYSVRTPDAVFYGPELERWRDATTIAYTRVAPEGSARPAGRVDAGLVMDACWPALDLPTCYVCGPTGFVEAVSDLLTLAGHDSARIRTERFGPSGGTR
jgi:ferredoxin-NADP reductase